MRELAKEELKDSKEQVEELEKELKILLLPKDPNDDKNVIVEIRAGAGGEEAALFAAEIYRMYVHYAENRGWKVETLDADETGIGGMKSVEFMVKGSGAYSILKYESGVHRVQRASLCNVSECERLGIGDKGTRLQVIKANKIIPKVINITEVVGSFVIPNECPVCHAPAVVRESESGTKTLHCTNAACPAKQLKKFARFVSKEGINIDGISEQTVWKFINHGFIREYADFYKLKNYAFEISCFEGFGKKSVSNLLESVEKSRHTDGRHLLYALNIPLCGGDVAKKLLSRYKVKELIETARLSMFDDEFASIDGIGPEKSAKFIAWFKDDVHFQHVQHLLSELIIEEHEPVETGNKCQGLTFVVTGDLHHYKNRNELKAYIESQGGKVTGSVSKSTNFLINNDAASQSSKNKKAHELNIPIITEDEFIEKFQE